MIKRIYQNLDKSSISADRIFVAAAGLAIACLVVLTFNFFNKNNMIQTNNAYPEAGTKEEQATWWCNTWELNHEECSNWTKAVFRFQSVEWSPDRGGQPVVAIRAKDRDKFPIFKDNSYNPNKKSL